MTRLLRRVADAVALVPLAFVRCVAFGGLRVCRWPRLVWLHLPAVGWGVLIEFAGWMCPLTPLEHHLRPAIGAAGYTGGGSVLDVDTDIHKMLTRERRHPPDGPPRRARVEGAGGGAVVM